MVAGRLAQGWARLEHRWGAWGPWRRFSGFAVIALVLGVALPGGRLPGPAAPTTTSPATVTTSTSASDASTTTLTQPDAAPLGDLGFDAATFLERWNAIPMDPELRTALLLSSFDVLDNDRGRVQVSIPEVEIDWTIEVELDPDTGAVHRLYFGSPFSETDEGSLASELGMVMVMTVVEEFPSIEESKALLNSLLDASVDTPEGGFAGEVRTDAARYSFTLTFEAGVELEVSP